MTCAGFRYLVRRERVDLGDDSRGTLGLSTVRRRRCPSLLSRDTGPGARRARGRERLRLHPPECTTQLANWQGKGWGTSPLAVRRRREYGGCLRVGSGPGQRWVLPSGTIAAFHARRHIDDACRGLPPDTIDRARLLVTELVSNAVLHAGGAVLLVVARDGAGLRVEVCDESPHLPVVRPDPSIDEHGNGLMLVDVLAASWGTDPRDDTHPGKCVWFTLA